MLCLIIGDVFNSIERYFWNVINLIKDIFNLIKDIFI